MRNATGPVLRPAFRRARALAAGTGLAALLAACTPEIQTHGYMPVEEKLAEIRVGADTRGSVQRKIGRPAMDALLSDDAWYYVASTVEHRAYEEPQVVERRVVEVVFDGDRVADLNRYGLEDGRIIDLETRTTPTYGRQLTVLEQIIGNLGAVRADQLAGDDN